MARITQPHVIAHFDLARGQTPENIVVDPDGTADVTFSVARQVARVSLVGPRRPRLRILAQLPATASSTCPLLGQLTGATALTMGIVHRHAGTLYVALCAGSADLQGIWQISPAGSPARIASLPPDGCPNGIALDERTGNLYIADALLSTVWRLPSGGNAVEPWVTGPNLGPDGFLGANGLKLHEGAVWVSNTSAGTLLRVPIEKNGSPGPIATIATGLSGIDDFDFTSPGDHAEILAAILPSSEVVLIQPNGTWQTVLTAADGLSNPTSVAVSEERVYVTSAAYLTRNDPNLLMADLH